VFIKDRGGNIIRVEGETGVIRYVYDAGGRLTEQLDEGSGERSEYRYDAAGNRVVMQNGNRDVRYSYGKNGELLRVFDNSQRLEVRYEYDITGRETRRVYGNGVKQETQYDQAGRVILIRELDAGNRLIRAEGYLYDELGRRSHRVDEQGRVTKYEYDTQSRLKTVWYPWTEEKSALDRKEAEEAGLYFTLDKGSGERYTFNGTELTALRVVLNRAAPARGNAVAASQMVWREQYTYDANGNRASKTTPWGTIAYSYDAENRLIKQGDIVYTYDKDGNLLSETGLRRRAIYQYNGQNRMVYSQITNTVEQSRVTSRYIYDALGRRTIEQDEGSSPVRTLYDGTSFEVVRSGVMFNDGRFTTLYSGGIQWTSNSGTEGSRYRWVSEEGGEVRTRSTGDSSAVTARYTGISVTLYGKGEAVAVTRSASEGSRGGPAYLGKDLLGSVMTATNEYGSLEERYEYDAFGQPYTGDLTQGMNLGYTGKPYDAATGLYNYGYRDYKPEAARFTTIDPIRDGANWFAYVNNDPVNWVDLLGLAPIYGDDIHGKPVVAYAGRDLKAETTIVRGFPKTSAFGKGSLYSEILTLKRLMIL
jgi:RHS repeat-associated protein